MITVPATDHQAEKDRSYRMRVTRGQRVALRRPVEFSQFNGWAADEPYTERETFPTGTVVTVVSESNAGFRGIEAHLRIRDGRTASVSTGALAPAPTSPLIDCPCGERHDPTWVTCDEVAVMRDAELNAGWDARP